MNLAFKAVQGEYVCMLSDDCLVVPDAIKNGITYFNAQREHGRKIGALAFYWRDWSHAETYHVGCTLGNKLYVNHGMYLNTALRDVEYIDEESFFFYNGDGDLCLKLWHKGYEILESPDSYIEHYPHANEAVRSTNEVLHKQDLQRYTKKWQGIFYDPALNNLGMQITKEFIDPAAIAQSFEAEYQAAVAKNPQLLRPASRLTELCKQGQWKYAAGVRKLKHFFGLFN